MVVKSIEASSSQWAFRKAFQVVRPLPFGSRFDAVGLEDVADGWSEMSCRDMARGPGCGRSPKSGSRGPCEHDVHNGRFGTRPARAVRRGDRCSPISGRSVPGASERMVSGVTMVATCLSIVRPRIFPLTARRRRWSSLSRMRFLPSKSLRTWFSVRQELEEPLWSAMVEPTGEDDDEELPGLQDEVHGRPPRTRRCKTAIQVVLVDCGLAKSPSSRSRRKPVAGALCNPSRQVRARHRFGLLGCTMRPLWRCWRGSRTGLLFCSRLVHRLHHDGLLYVHFCPSWRFLSCSAHRGAKAYPGREAHKRWFVEGVAAGVNAILTRWKSLVRIQCRP